MSLIKIYLKFLKNTPTYFGHSTIIREFFSSSLKSLLSTTLLDIPILKTGDVSACRVMCVELYLERISKSVVDKSDFSEELKKLPDDGRMTETCRSVFKKF